MSITTVTIATMVNATMTIANPEAAVVTVRTTWRL